MRAASYLDTADRLLAGQFPDAAGVWPRACVWMLRLALEDALRELWLRTNPPVADVSMRAQLLSLRLFDALAPHDRARAAYLWDCLSRAGHYHPYELSPTAAELRAWHRDVEDLVALLGATGTPA